MINAAAVLLSLVLQSFLA